MRDLTNLKTYIIDSENPHEVDDAISLEIKEGDTKILWIHISNPCGLFLLDSDVDIESRNKNSSIYLTEQYLPMLPAHIIEDANLQQNKVSNTISASIEFKNNGSISNYEIVEAIIKPKYQLTYEDADEIIDLEPKEEEELIILKNILLKSAKYRISQGAILFDNKYSKIMINKDNIILTKVENTISRKIISEAMVLMGYVTSLFLINNNLSGVYRSQNFNFDSIKFLQRYKDSEIKYILLKQYMGKSYISTKPNKHDCLGLESYVQCTSPLRRYLDLIIQRQVYNKINNKELIDKNTLMKIIDFSRIKQKEINNIYKNDKLKYLRLFFKKEDKMYYKIIFVKWINHKRNIALVYFPDYLLELLIIFYVSIDIYTNNIYKVKYTNNNCNLLEFIY